MDLHSSILALFGLPGHLEVIIILVLAVLLFGRRLPEIARGAGKSLSEFKKGIKEAQDEVEDSLNDDDVDNSKQNDPQ